MPAPKFLSVGSGVPIQEVASIATSAGAGDADKLVSTGADGKIDRTLLPQDPVQSFTASEAIAAGDLINIWDSTGPKVRKADASGGIAKMAHGFAPSAIANAATGLVVLGDEVISGKSGLTVGANYFLGTTPGAVQSAPPTGAGHIVQMVGVAVSVTALSFKAGENPIVRA